MLERRDGYEWGPSTAGHTGEAYLDTITYKVIPESGNRTGSLQSGQIDATTGIATADAVLFEGDDFWSAEPGQPRRRLQPVREPVDREARRRERAPRDPEGHRPRADHVDPAQSGRPARRVACSPHRRRTSPTSATCSRTTPRAAAELLEEAGWTEGDDGIRQKDGEKLSFHVTYWQSPKEVLELVQQQLRQIGVDLQLTFASIADVQAANADGTYDFSYGNLTRADPDVLRTVFSVTSPNNNTKRTEPAEIDELLDEQAAITDPAERQKVVDEAASLLITGGYTHPDLPAVDDHHRRLEGAGADVRGVQPPGLLRRLDRRVEPARASRG